MNGTIEDTAFDPADTTLTYYGPHACNKCGELIAKVSFEQGGAEFDFPREGPYPNSVWPPHSCDPARIEILRSDRSFPQRKAE